MSETRIRKQVYDLTPSDLERYPVWEFALDEEGLKGQDEATVRPRPDAAEVWSADVARTTFMSADGSQFIGYETPDVNPRYLQPTIVTENGQVNFWFGWQDDGISDEMIRPKYEQLRKTAEELFPITYRVDLPWNNGSALAAFEGEITGFGWLPTLGSDEVRVRR